MTEDFQADGFAHVFVGPGLQTALPVAGHGKGSECNDRRGSKRRVLAQASHGLGIGLVGLVADYARVSSVARSDRSIAGVVAGSLAFIRSHFGAVVVLYVITGAIFVLITIAYGVLEIYGGSQVGGWRAIAIGQAYVLARLGIRLTFASSELRLFNASHTAAAV